VGCWCCNHCFAPVVCILIVPIERQSNKVTMLVCVALQRRKYTVADSRQNQPWPPVVHSGAKTTQHVRRHVF